MKSKAQKWGNSLGTIIPKQIVKKLKLQAGSPITFSETDNGGFIINNDITELDKLLEKITIKNKHTCLLDDDSRGNEIW